MVNGLTRVPPLPALLNNEKIQVSIISETSFFGYLQYMLISIVESGGI